MCLSALPLLLFALRASKYSTRRADVKADLASTQKNGTLKRFYREDSGSFDLTTSRSSAGTQPGVASK